MDFLFCCGYGHLSGLLSWPSKLLLWLRLWEGRGPPSSLPRHHLRERASDYTKDCSGLGGQSEARVGGPHQGQVITTLAPIFGAETWLG